MGGYGSLRQIWRLSTARCRTRSPVRRMQEVRRGRPTVRGRDQGQRRCEVSERRRGHGQGRGTATGQGKGQPRVRGRATVRLAVRGLARGRVTGVKGDEGAGGGDDDTVEDDE